MPSGTRRFSFAARSPLVAILVAAIAVSAALGVILLLRNAVPNLVAPGFLFIFIPAIGLSGYVGRRAGGLASAAMALAAVAGVLTPFEFSPLVTLGAWNAEVALAVFGLAGAATGLGAARIADLQDERGRLLGGERRARQEAQAAERRLSVIARASAELAKSFDYVETLQGAARLAIPSLADLCVIDLLNSDGDLVRVARAHMDPRREATMEAAEPALRQRLANPDHPVRQVARSGNAFMANAITEEMWNSYIPERQRTATVTHIQSLLSVPLTAHGTVLGVLSLGSLTPNRYDDADLATAQDLAQRATLALENARLYASERAARTAAEDAQRRLSFLADASRELVASFDYPDAMQRVARLAVRAIGQRCVVDLLDEAGRVQRVARAHADPTHERLMWEIDAQLIDRLQSPNHPVQRVLRTREPFVDNDMRDETWQAFVPPAHHDLAQQSIDRSLLCVPLEIRGAVVGVMSFGASAPGCFGPQDVELALDLAKRASLGLENTQLYAAERTARVAAEAAQERLRFLAEASRELGALLDYREALQQVARLALALIGERCAIDVLDERGAPIRVARAHVDPGRERAMYEEDVYARDRAENPNHPVQRVLRSRTPIVDNEMTDDSWRAYVPVEDHALARRSLDRSIMAVPMEVRGKVIGVMSFGSSKAAYYDGGHLQMAMDLAGRAALAVENARLFAGEREARTRAEKLIDQLEELQRVTEVPLSHLEVEDLLREFLRRIRGMLAVDTASVLLLDAEANELVVRAAVGLEEEAEQAVRIPVGGGFTGRIAAARRPMTIVDTDQAEILSPILRARGLRSLAGAPLLVEGRLIGVLYAGTMRQRTFGADEIRLLQLLADRVALTVENARLYQNVRGTAEILQRSLLPQTLPESPWVAMAAKYVPGSEAAEVGGDWYDVIPLDAGRLMLVMGDVAGKGVPAAAAMGQIRSALRAYALEGNGPSAIAGRLSWLIEPGQMATLFCAVLDPEAWTLTYTAAGHPPPLVVAPQGEATFLSDARARPLARLGAPNRFTQTTTQLPPGSTILLYTDGLVERRDASLDVRLAALRIATERAASLPIEAMLDAVIDAMLERPSTAADDVAVLAVRPAPGTNHCLRLEMPAEPESIAELRHALRRWLAAAQVGMPDIEDVTLAACEAATNAVEHAYGVDDHTFLVEASRKEDEIVVVVRDHGRWRPSRSASRGRGLGLMRSLMSTVDVSSEAAGTTITMTKKRSPTAPGNPP